MGRKRLSDGDREAAQQPQGTAESPVVFVQHVPKPPEAIPDFDKTVPGGRYVVNGVLVDAHGKAIPEGRDAQDPAVVARSKEQAEDLSKLADPAFNEPPKPAEGENATNVATTEPPANTVTDPQ